MIHGLIPGSYERIIDRIMPRSRTITREATRFAAVLQRLRRQRQWTLAKLAQRAGLTPTYVGILERGENLPSLTVIFDLCEVLGVHPADVIREVAAERFPPAPAQ